MHYKLLACDVLQRMVWHCAARASHTFYIDFTPKDAHNDSTQLRAILQKRIDSADRADPPFDAVLLAYGLCDNATTGSQAQIIPLVILPTHDC